jgi:hypothetical protein
VTKPNNGPPDLTCLEARPPPILGTQDGSGGRPAGHDEEPPSPKVPTSSQSGQLDQIKISQEPQEKNKANKERNLRSRGGESAAGERWERKEVAAGRQEEATRSIVDQQWRAGKARRSTEGGRRAAADLGRKVLGFGWLPPFIHSNISTSR